MDMRSTRAHARVQIPRNGRKCQSEVGADCHSDVTPAFAEGAGWE